MSKRAFVRTLTAALIALSGVLIQPGSAYADPGPDCAPPPDDVMLAGEAGEPYASQVTCKNPDGSYSVCTTAGTAGNGPTNCTNYPAAPTDGASPPVPAPPLPGQG